MRIEYSIEHVGLPYTDALKIIEALENAGIDAGITAGGVSVWCEEDLASLAATVIDEACPGVRMHKGAPAHQQRVHAKYDAMKRKATDAN